MTLYKKALEQFEKEWLEKYIEYYKYNQTRTAQAMGVSRGTLRTKLIRYFGDKYFRDSVNEGD